MKHLSVLLGNLCFDQLLSRGQNKRNFREDEEEEEKDSSSKRQRRHST
jgi:hypothetical protein